MNKYIRRLWYTIGLILLFIPCYVGTVYWDLCGLYGPLPSLYNLENPRSEQSSELYSSDGVLLGKYFRNNRSMATYESISPHLINALLATEDHRFYAHSGLDLIGILRAFIRSIILFQRQGGGSTLTQQLAKNLFKTRTERQGILGQVPIISMLIFKTKECIVAVQLERNYTKQEILAMYLNTVSFGRNTFGIQVAARTFFNTTPDLLQPEQSALLVGMLQAPSTYDPILNPALALSRRNTVLKRMYYHKYITQGQYEKLIETPIKLQYNIENQNSGLATYFRSSIRGFLKQWTAEHGYDLFGDGLKIYTTIDSRLQQHAEKAVCLHMSKLQKQFDEHWKNRDPWVDELGKPIPDFISQAIIHTDRYTELVHEHGDDSSKINQLLQTPVPVELFSWSGEIQKELSPIEELKYIKRLLHSGFMAMEPETGHIKAWVGGINYKHFKFDHVQQSKRQPGSLFKPIVYTAAIDNGYTPWQKITDTPVTFKVHSHLQNWTPQNWNKAYSGRSMTLREALSRSVNSITAHLTKKLSPSVIVDYAQRLGIQSPLEAVPSICLGGAGDVSLKEIVGAYNTFINKGIWVEPNYITRIEDKHGRVIQSFTPNKREAICERTAYLMTYLLKGFTEEPGGMGRCLPEAIKKDNEIAGKTGTTSNQSDGWFVGMTKNLCVGVWVGADDRCIHFRTIGQGGGATIAMPIWKQFIQDVYADHTLSYNKGPLLNYNPPSGLVIPSKHDNKNTDTDKANSDQNNNASQKPRRPLLDAKDIL